jgi:hypothetical protein
VQIYPWFSMRKLIRLLILLQLVRIASRRHTALRGMRPLTRHQGWDGHLDQVGSYHPSRKTAKCASGSDCINTRTACGYHMAGSALSAKGCGRCCAKGCSLASECCEVSRIDEKCCKKSAYGDETDNGKGISAQLTMDFKDPSGRSVVAVHSGDVSHHLRRETVK